jgi:excisionase family DNA binding protein
VNLSVSLSDEDVERVARRVAALVGESQPAVDPLLTVEEAADYLRCEKQRVYDLASSRRLAAAKDGRRSLFRRSALDAYLGEGS